jgi:hypothetical protein
LRCHRPTASWPMMTLLQPPLAPLALLALLAAGGSTSPPPPPRDWSKTAKGTGGVKLNASSTWIQYLHRRTADSPAEVFFIRDGDYWTRQDAAPAIGVKEKNADGAFWREVDPRKAAAASAAAAKPGRKRQRRISCGKRVGCDECVADERCLWCASPRRCMDTNLPVEELYKSCSIQEPVPFCVDMNLEKEREGFVRPCAREIGGSLTLEDTPLPEACCGDGVCDAPDVAQAAWWAGNGGWAKGMATVLAEDLQNCPVDCPAGGSERSEEAAAQNAKLSIPQKLIDTAESTTAVFGALQEVVHDTYHCEDTFDEGSDGVLSSPCSPKSQAHRPSQWLEELVLRDATLLTERSSQAQVETFLNYRRHSDERRSQQRRTYSAMLSAGNGFSGCRADLSCDPSLYPPLPFRMPKFGRQVVEFGAGLGQDTRNLADAGYKVLGVEVSADAAAEARAITAAAAASGLLSADAAARFSYVNYDALALPKPLERIDLLVDMTVYCGLRHRYLSRLYDLWERVLAPGHTILMISCWKGEPLADGTDPDVPVVR